VEEKVWEEAERQRVAEEEEDDGVSPAALGRDVRRRGCPIEGG